MKKLTPVFTQDWFSHNTLVWEHYLLSLKKPKLKALEIGCFEGRSSLWLLNNLIPKDGQLHVVDTFEGSIEHAKLKIKKENLQDRFLKNINSDPRVKIHVGKSQEILRKFECKQKFDFVYIDGSHLAKDVLEDAVLSWRLLKKGGIMIFDDFRWRLFKRDIDNPYPAIIVFLDFFRDELVELRRQYQVIVQKII